MRSVTSRFDARSLRPDGLTLLIAGLSILGTLLILAREATYGVVLNWDSANYIYVARSLLSGDGFAQIHTTDPYINWPPLYPALLAVTSLFVFDPRDVAGPLNIAVFGITAFIVGMYLRRRVESRFLVVWGCLAVIFSLPLAHIASQAMSESVFVLLVLASLIHLDNFLIESKGRSLMWSAVFGALALLARYLGIALIALVLVVLLLQHGVAVRERFKRVFVFVSVSMIPFCVWMIRNYAISGEFTAVRETYARYSIGEIGGWMRTVLMEWLLLSDSWVIGIASVSAMAATVVYMTIAGLRTSSAKRPGRRSFYLFCGFAVAYILVLAVAMVLGRTGYGLQPRYLVPVYIPLVAVLVFALDMLFRDASNQNLLGSLDSVPLVRSMVSRWYRLRSKSILVLILMIMLSAWIGYGMVLNARQIARANSDAGNGYYTTARWVDSEVLRYFRANSIDEAVISNAQVAFYTHIDVSSRYPPLLSGLDDQIERFEKDLDGAYVVWFLDNDIRALFDYDVSQLRTLPGLQLVADLDDGVIFRVDRSYAGVADEYRSLYASLVSSAEPVIRSEFDVFLGDDELHYVKDPCIADDTENLFFLHVNPVSADDLPEERLQHGFDNLDFVFGRYGVTFDGKCFATVQLPAYEIHRITTGQFARDEGDLWRGSYSLSAPRALDAVREFQQSDVEPAIRSVFDVYISDGRLVYVKQQCTEEDRETRFFLHVRPADVSDLLVERQELGFKNLDFDLWDHGGESDGGCFAAVQLPEYQIASISTGQYTPDGRVWSTELEVGSE